MDHHHPQYCHQCKLWKTSWHDYRDLLYADMTLDRYPNMLHWTTARNVFGCILSTEPPMWIKTCECEK